MCISLREWYYLDTIFSELIEIYINTVLLSARMVEVMPSRIRMLYATRALSPVLQLTTISSFPLTSPTRSGSFGRGIAIEPSITPPDSNSGTFLTSRWTYSLRSLSWGKPMMVGWLSSSPQSSIEKLL